MLNKLLIIFSLLLILFAGACANLGTAFVGSALGVAGNQSFKYFHRGTVKSVFYGDMEQLIYSVEKSMNDLSLGVCHRVKYKDGQVKLSGKTASTKPRHIDVCLIPIGPRITEVVVMARKGVFPEKTLSYLLMKSIVENLDGDGQFFASDV